MNAPRAIVLCQNFSGALEFQAGNWAKAEQALRESVALYREIGAASGEASSCQRLGMLLTAQGKLEEGMAFLEEGISISERATMRAHLLTRINATIARNRLKAGEILGADQALLQGLTMSDRHGNCTTCDALLLPVAVSVRKVQNDLSAAEDFCLQLEETSEEYGSRIWVAMARQARAELSEAQGNLDQAVELYAEASGAYKDAGYSYEVVRCLRASARNHRRRGKSDEAESAHEKQRKADIILQELGVN